jgi:hypothetical protein
VAVFKVLTEMICLEELFSLVAFTEFINVSQMLSSSFLIIRKIREFFTIVTADII